MVLLMAFIVVRHTLMLNWRIADAVGTSGRLRHVSINFVLAYIGASIRLCFITKGKTLTLPS
jgi:hypothetical protein